MRPPLAPQTSAGALPAAHKAKDFRFYTLSDDVPPPQEGDKPTRRGGDGAKAATAAQSFAAAAPAPDTDSSSEDDDASTVSVNEAHIPETTAPTGRVALVYRGFVQNRVFLHPASANFGVQEWACPWLVYLEKAETGQPGERGERGAGRGARSAIRLGWPPSPHIARALPLQAAPLATAGTGNG